MTPIDVDSVGDLLGLLIVGLVVVTSAVVPAWITARRTRGLHSDVAEMKSQVVNSHGDRPDQNLRVQLDRIEARQHSTAGDIRGLRTDFGDLRGEVRDARRDHRDFEARVHTAYRREHPGAQPL